MKTDDQLKTDVMRELAWDGHIDATAIGVSAHHGVVTLNGIVDCWAEKRAIEAAAHRTAGVLDVANEIEVKPVWSTAQSDADIAETVRAALARDQLVPDQQIHATVSDHGIVSLIGRVETLAQREAAERAVRDLAGVRCLANQLTVESLPFTEGADHEAVARAPEHTERTPIRVQTDSAREATLGGVVVRVDPGFALDLHLDTGEANGAELDEASVVAFAGVDPRAVLAG
jgi:osmotically-inducible protein OsmY